MVWAFLPAIYNDFTSYDDPDYVTANPHVQSGLSRVNIRWAFESTQASNWHPLTWLSHMADWQVYGANPLGHHLTSVLLHGINSVLVFLVLRRMTGAVWRSLLVAALFGLHPLRVESVAWVAERKDVLSTLFGMLTIWAYARYAEKRSRVESRESRARSGKTTPAMPALDPRPSTLDSLWTTTGRSYLLALVFFALGLMSKPMLVTLPFVLVLLDYWPLGRFQSFRVSEFQSFGVQSSDPEAPADNSSTPNSQLSNFFRLVVEKIPFVALAAASCAITFVAQKRGGAMVLMSGQSLGARATNALVSYCRYLGKFFWPKDLSVIYPVVDHWPVRTVLAAVLLLLGVSVGAVLLRQRRPYLLTGWFWFLGTLVPVLGLVAVGEQSMADRYTYYPTIGVAIMLVWGANDLGRRRPYQALVSSTAGAAVIIALIALMRQNLGYWRNSETLYRHAIASTENNYSAFSNLGNVFLGQGRLDDALSQFQQAVRLQPGSAEARANLGAVLAMSGRLDESISQFQEAQRLNPNSAEVHHNLGKALQNKGKLDDAIVEYEQAIKLNPNGSDPHNSLGAALAMEGRLDQAIIEFREALRLDPSSASAQRNLSTALSLKDH